MLQGNDEMDENPEMNVSSAKQLSEVAQKREKEALKKVAAEHKSLQFETDKIALLKEANDLALKAHVEAQESMKKSEKSSRRALWSNIIAVASLLVAIASFVLAYVSSMT